MTSLLKNLKKVCKNKIVIFGAVLLVLLFTLLFYLKFQIVLLGINMGIDIPNINNFKVTDNYKGEKGEWYAIEAKKDSIIIRIKSIKSIGKEASEEYKNYQLKMINSVFEPIKSPYPGRITREIVCPEELKPIEVNTADFNSAYYLLYSTDRHSYGACSWDSVKYRVIFLFRYCEKNKELYQVELFIPIGEFNDNYTKMAGKIRCR